MVLAIDHLQNDDIDKRVPIVVASQPLGTRSTHSLPLLHDTVSGTFNPLGQTECKTDGLLWFGYDRHPGRPEISDRRRPWDGTNRPARRRPLARFQEH